MIKIIDKEQCCGCSACLHICPKNSITFKEDKEGFLYPSVNMETCIDCGLCEKVCPVLNQDEERIPEKVYAAKHEDDEIRMKSSSGGIFTLLAEHVIDDGGVVFGARFNEKWEVIHDYTESKEGLAPFRGSKYVQSNIRESYKQVADFLKEGRKVMFTGTPCQVAGLKKYLRKDYDNLLTVDFICHGVPSPMVWRKYLDEEIYSQYEVNGSVQENSSKLSPVLTSVNFRDKSTGWKKYSVAFKYTNIAADEERNIVISSIFTDNTFMKAFLSNLSLRPSCYSCPAKSGKSGSNITIGDFWGLENVISGLDDDKGMSLICINDYNILNADVTDVIRDKKRVDFFSSINENSCMLKSVNKPINRKFFFNCLTGYNIKTSLQKATSARCLCRLQRILYRGLYGAFSE